MRSNERTTRESGRRARRAEHGDLRRLSGSWRFVTFRTPVRGYRFAARPPRAEPPAPGQRAGLLREGDHPYDPWAVGVWVRSGDGNPWRIGYLERAVAARIGPHLDEGDRVLARVAGWTPEPGGRWWRPVIEVSSAGSRAAGPDVRRRSGQPRKTA